MPESELQHKARNHVYSALSIRYQSRPEVYVAGDMFLYYRMNDAGARLAPDVMVVFDAAPSPARDRPGWCGGKGAWTPDFALKIASPGTVADDAGWKRDRYAMMEVSEYWRFDPQGGEFDTGAAHRGSSGRIGRNTVRCRWRRMALAFCAATASCWDWTCAWWGANCGL